MAATKRKTFAAGAIGIQTIRLAQTNSIALWSGKVFPGLVQLAT